MKQFLPISRADMQAQGMEQLDFVYVIGDAYVDHPSFGHAIISRILQANGFSVLYNIPFGWLKLISSASTPIYLNTSYKAFPKCPKATAPW